VEVGLERCRTDRVSSVLEEDAMYCPNPECIDFQEDGAPGEYVDTVTMCPKCGTALVAELPPDWPDSSGTTVSADEPGFGGCRADPLQPLPPEVIGRGTFVPLAAFDYPDEAEVLLDHLATAEITAVILLDDGRDFQDKGGVPTCSRVLVPEEQYRTAASILAALDRS
jgi:hypothetical protein